MAIKISGVTIIDDSRNIVSGAAATFTSNVTIGGTLTYEDVTNIDSVGIITARQDVHIGDSIVHIGDTDTKIIFTDNVIQLQGGGTTRLKTTSTGIQVAGRLNIINNNITDTTNSIGLRLHSGAFQPTDGTGNLTNGTKSLGTSSNKFANVYATTLYGDGANLTGITAEGIGAIGGLTVKNQSGSVVGTGGSISTLDFNGSSGVNVTATSGASGIATILISSAGFFEKTDVGINTVSKVGIGTTNPIAQLDVNVGSSVTALNIEGSEGQLFSVTNNLSSGSIFAVNDITGLPSIDVNADGTIQLAPRGAGELVGIGTTLPSSKLHLVGDAFITGVATAGIVTATSLFGRLKTDEHQNLYVGVNAGSSNTLAACNIAIGHSAGNGLCGCDNVILGSCAGNGFLLGGSTQTRNVLIGKLAGQCSVSSTNNVYLGYGAGRFNTSAVNNIGIGYAAIRCPGSGSGNVALGSQAMRNATGGGNVALGGAAGCAVTGCYNLFFGCGAGSSTTSGFRNLIFGHQVQASSVTADDELVIGCCTGRWVCGDSSFNVTLAGIVTASTAGSILANTATLKACALDTDIFSIKRSDHASSKLFRIFQDSSSGGGAGGPHINTFNRNLMITASTSAATDSGVYLRTSGQFGVGTNNPTSKLSVAGDACVSGVSTFSGNVTSTGDLIISSSLPRITLNDTNHESDFDIKNENGSFRIRDLDNPTDRYRINSSGTIHEFFGAADFNSHLTIDGNINANGNIVGDTSTDITGINTVGANLYYGCGGIGSRLFQQDSLTNMIAGTNAGLAITVGTSPAPQGNILIGECTGSRINTSCLTVAIGKMAGACITGGSGQNTFVGSVAGQKAGCCGHTTVNGNTFLGMQAGKCAYNPIYNTFIGYSAGLGHADSTGGSGGSCNVAIGFHAAGNMRSGHNNVSIGRYTGVSNSTGDNNFASGNFALACNLTGSSNIAIGKEALSLTCTGSYNIALGNRSLYCNTTATFNVALGYYALYHNTTFGGSIAIGCKAGCCALCGPNIMIGEGTGMFLNGCHNTLLGTSAGTKATEATGNTFIGRLSGGCNTTGSKNVSVGWNAGLGNTTGSGNINVGRESGALSCGATGSANISMGQFSGKCISSAQCNISIGECAACCLSTGGCNVAIGQNAGRGYATASNNVSIGQNSGAQSGNSSGSGNITLGHVGSCISSGSGNIAIGCAANMGTGNVTGDANISMGPYTGRRLTSGGYNTFISGSAGRFTTTGSRNVFIGIFAGYCNVSGGCNVAIGCNAGRGSAAAFDNISMGRAALYLNEIGSGNVAIGHSASHGVRGSDNISIGATSGPANSCTDTHDNVFIGRQVGSSLTSGCSNIFMGVCAGVNAGTATSAIVIGNCAGKCFSPSLNQHGSGYGNIFVGEYAGKCVTTGIVNVLIGKCAGCCLHGSHTTIAIGANAGAKTCAANDNVFVGTSAGECNTTGATNVMIGNKVGRVTTTGNNNIFLGQFAGCYNAGGSSNVYVGNCSGYKTQGNNNVMLGLSAGHNRCGSKFNHNTLVGRSAGTSCGTLAIGNFDVFVGYTAGKCYTGSCSIGIGHSVRMPITDGQNQLAIGQDTCHWITGTCDYNVGIGTTNPTSKLHVVANDGDAAFKVGTALTVTGAGHATFSGVTTFRGTNNHGRGAIHIPYNCMLVFGDSYLRGAIYNTGAQLNFQALNTFRFRVWDGGGMEDWMNVHGPGGSVKIGGCHMGVAGSTNRTHMFMTSPHFITMCSSVPDSSTLTKRFELDSYGIQLTGITTVAGNLNVTGVVTATHFYGDGSNLTGISGGGGISTTFFASSAAGIHTLSKVGIGTAIPEAQLDVNVGSGVTALNISGSEGQLFSVTNNLTSGSIFEVNDVSGMPSIDVNADGTIQLAPHGTGELVGIGTTIPTSKLHVVGTLTAEKYKGDTNNNIIMGCDPNTVATSGLGTANVFIGEAAGKCNTDACMGVFIGYEAGKCNTTATHNVAIGYRAGCCLKTGNSNTILGPSAGQKVCSGGANVFLGSQAAICATTAGNSVVIGLVAGKTLTTGTNNVFIGRMAGCKNTTGSANVYMGNCSGYCAVGNNNVMLGANSGFHRSGSKYNYNTLLGNYAGRTAGTLAVGNFDVLLGYLAGECYTGTCSIGIGHSLRMPITAGTNQLAIGQETNYWITGSCDYNVGIGISIPTSKLHVVGDTCVSGIITATNFAKADGTPIASTDIAINTLSSSSGTGGGSASFNGTAYRFTLSEPPDTSVYQLQVSINGVIQKPNAGSSQPSEGFAIDGNDIIFGSPPPAGSPFFITTFKTVGISSIPPQAQVSTTSAAKSVKNVTTSTSAPTNSNGVDGDLWFTYIA